jgi:hypothetical protein
MISIFYYLGFLHGKRYSVRKTNGQADTDHESEKMLIDALPPEVSAIRLGADPAPAAEKIKALLLASKTENRPRNGEPDGVRIDR